jgi:hypothetical protein
MSRGNARVPDTSVQSRYEHVHRAVGYDSVKIEFDRAEISSSPFTIKTNVMIDGEQRILYYSRA